MMFIHGGNFRSGGASAILYDGRFLAILSNTVVVSTNYRLGKIHDTPEKIGVLIRCLKGLHIYTNQNSITFSLVLRRMFLFHFV